MIGLSRKVRHEAPSDVITRPALAPRLGGRTQAVDDPAQRTLTNGAVDSQWAEEVNSI